MTREKEGRRAEGGFEADCDFEVYLKVSYHQSSLLLLIHLIASSLIPYPSSLIPYPSLLYSLRSIILDHTLLNSLQLYSLLSEHGEDMSSTLCIYEKMT